MTATDTDNVAFWYDTEHIPEDVPISSFCDHRWVNASLMHIVMVCYYCDKEYPT